MNDEKSELNIISKKQKYVIQNKVFIVEPIFKDSGKETIGTILLRLMKNEIDSA